ncbi:MAG: polysaccharide deacetylase family protein [Gammaproteobacteria bacterium]|nr:polysaccharide deacetylase family protein [Gammaproteobacteria bacterium]
MMTQNVKVVISVDAEFTINSAFKDPDNYAPCAQSLFSPDQETDVGFNDLLNLLNRHQVKATFFTEALNAHYFGIDEMKKHVSTMLRFDHDVQLHTHPVWQEFRNTDWKNIVVNKKLKDNFLNMSSTDIQQVLGDAIDIFEQWTGKKPLAFRAGNLQASLELYDALDKTGFKLASNIGLPIYRPTEDRLNIENQVTYLSNIVEFPVTTFQSMGIRHKALTIQGTSTNEIKQVLKQCKKLGIKHVIVLTHVHEFIKTNPLTQQKKANKVNLSRLNKLCLFVKNENGFEFSTFAHLANEQQHDLTANEQPKPIQTSILAGLWTVIQNSLNNKIWRY